MWVVLGNAISASKLLNLQTPEKADSVLALLRSHGFSQLQISKFVRSCPKTLLSCTEKTLLTKLKFFASVGVSREDLARTAAANPCLLAVSLEKRIVPTYNFLRSLLSEKNVIGVFKRRSWIFLVDHCKDVVPNIGLLRELDMPQPSISLLLAHYTHVTMNKHKRFGKIVGEVKEMGFSLRTSTFVSALHTLCGKSSKLIWKRSCKIFMSWGWSEDDFLSAFRKNPEFTIVSEKTLVQVMDFLVNKMGWPSGMIARYPRVMRHSLEKRIRPRSLVVKVFRLKGLIDENLSLGHVMHPQDRLLLERFVTKFQIEVPQLWNVYQGKVGIEDV
ncbi:transcription termination factor MTERF6, chloroplastic/mitochondrial-like [Pyrus communis]|uniref:transcription termination factor MTERF6, chloroplastic/mitochondrial-like n=1 Tax=Pyrus communis TaxID=23211 RepID=UPI0035C06DB3